MVNYKNYYLISSNKAVNTLLLYIMSIPSGINTRGTIIFSYFSIVSDINGIFAIDLLNSHKTTIPIAKIISDTSILAQSRDAKNGM